MSEQQQAAAPRPPTVKERRDRLHAILKDLHQETNIVAEDFHLKYSDASLLLINLHVNELHRIAMMEEAERKAAKQG